MIARRFFWILLTLAVISAFAAPVPAADLTFYVGGVKPGSITFNDTKTMLDSSPIFGARLGTKIVPHFGTEHTLGFSSDYLFPRNIEAVRNARGFVYNSNLIFDLPVPFEHAVPYITAGAGLIHQYGDSNLPVGTKFAVNYGGGLKMPRMAGPVGLRFDIRGYSAGVFSNKLNLLEISGGVMFSIGK